MRIHEQIDRERNHIPDASAILVYWAGALTEGFLEPAALESSCDQTRRRSTRSDGSVSMTSRRNPARSASGICLSVSPSERRRTILVLCSQDQALTPILRNLGGDHDRCEGVDPCGVVEELRVGLAEREGLFGIGDGFAVLAETQASRASTVVRIGSRRVEPDRRLEVVQGQAGRVGEDVQPAASDSKGPPARAVRRSRTSGRRWRRGSL